MHPRSIRARGALGALALAVLGAFPLATSTPAGAVDGTWQTTVGCGTEQSFTLPVGTESNLYEVTVNAIGAPGGHGGMPNFNYAGTGGTGAQVLATYEFSGGQQFTAVKGCPGHEGWGDTSGSISTSAGYSLGYWGGIGNSAGVSPRWVGGGGGGSTAVCTGATCTDTDGTVGTSSTPLVVAGGGGGGGASNCAGIAGDGADAGSGTQVPDASSRGRGPSGGTGANAEAPATQTGGAGGDNSLSLSRSANGTPGGTGQEGTGTNNGGGGGGGGFVGGNGGHGSNWSVCSTAAGGGAGSSWYANGGASVTARTAPDRTARVTIAYREIAGQPPAAPTGLAVSALDRAGRFVWTAPTNTGDGPVLEYRVDVRLGADVVASDTLDMTTVPAPTLRLTVGGLENGVTYSAVVYARNQAGGWGPASGAVSLKPAGAPDAPGNVTTVITTPTVGGVTGGSVALTWVKPADNGSAITGYKLRVPGRPVVDLGANLTSTTVTGLDLGRRMDIRLAAVNSTGEGRDAVIDVQIPDTPRRPAPPSAQLTSPGADSAVITWESPGLPFEAATRFEVQANDGTADLPAIAVDAPALTITAAGFSRDATYRFRVRAGNAVGWSAWSGLSGPLKVHDVPPAPTVTLRADTLPGGNRVTADGTTPQYPGLDNLSTTITLSEGATVVATRTFATGETRDWVFSDVRAGHTYTAVVSTLNAAGTSAGSAPASVTVPLPDIAPFATLTAFVNQQYLDLLGRAPTAAERTAALDALELGTATPEQFVTSLLPDTYTTLDASIIRLYLAFFNRPPDTSGMAYWTAQVTSGRRNLDTAAQQFAQSSEFIRTYGTLSNRAFVQRIYLNVLGREGEAAGVDFWTSQLATSSRGRVVRQISEAPENRRAKEHHVDIVRLYLAMLDRTPTAAEFTANLPRTIEMVAGVIRRSAPYQARFPG